MPNKGDLTLARGAARNLICDLYEAQVRLRNAIDRVLTSEFAHEEDLPVVRRSLVFKSIHINEFDLLSNTEDMRIIGSTPELKDWASWQLVSDARRKLSMIHRGTVGKEYINIDLATIWHDEFNKVQVILKELFEEPYRVTNQL